MTSDLFTAEAFATLEQAYPNTPCRIGHGLVGHPLLELDRLAELAGALPADSVEHNLGAMPIGIDPQDIPASQLGIVETIRTIDESKSWAVLKRIEQDPRYAELLASVLAQLEGVILPRTGPMLELEGFVFISSPGSITPFHFDPEHNVLLQLRGSKTMTVFPAHDDRLADPRIHEAFHLGQHHRNLPWQEEFGAAGQAMTIRPGQALYVPVKAPHWVQNGPEVSISLSVTWRSEWSFAEADARAFNHMLRGLGLNPASPAPYPHRNLAKSLGHRAIRKLRGGLGR
ncbi:bifunctional arginine demethylase and lysyl-hydroxylase [Novosphingobium sp. JCM 18896]|uniref:bifunctional arginine demethylase and lysyl-hydroxylase n=1 Tax=Novosphingobium sp. JCM 18896 TaxID=2989731 RepID=UPI002221F6EC|nr:bifunctional arginine demethylase and lysyl-hydroxylase [Novosphingobium sp. JCM 18896]MCW1429429.1 bifunctional arginine demethylase and lysyl-hydroxylase [Novosphingobium sp. JCM 18896]